MSVRARNDVSPTSPEEAPVSTWIWVALAVVVIVIAVGAVSSAIRRRRSHILQSGFGPEYDRTVERTGDQSAAEADLRDRQRRREELELRPLAPVARKGYMDAWQGTQAEFVDDPGSAVDDADRLIQSVMRDRGYPVEDFDDRASLVSVDHPIVVERYRRAHAIAVESANGDATTESLRRAMQDYRALFVELVEDGDTAPAPAPR
jgi:hypothetical protein